MAREPIDPARLRMLRDAAILHIYNNAAADRFNINGMELARAIGASLDEISAVAGLLSSQGFEGNSSTQIGAIGLSEAGQREAERLGPLVRFREQDNPSQVVIHANYSVVQVAGPNSTLAASLSVQQSVVEQLLTEIEATLPAMRLSEPQRDEAKGLVASLRQGLTSKLTDAGMRAIGGALGSLLVAAGSPLGQRLMELLNITVGR